MRWTWEYGRKDGWVVRDRGRVVYRSPLQWEEDPRWEGVAGGAGDVHELTESLRHGSAVDRERALRRRGR